MKRLLGQLSNYLWSLEKGGRYILKSYNSLTFPPILIRNPQIKAQSVHFYRTVTWICFGQELK